MRLLKEKRKIAIVIAIVMSVYAFAGCGESVNKKLLENVEMQEALIDMKYFDGEKTELRYAYIDMMQKLYDEINEVKIKPVSLKKVREMKAPCYGIEIPIKDGDIDITYCDGLVLKGIAKMDCSGEKYVIKHEYELYETDYDFKALYDKYGEIQEKDEDDEEDYYTRDGGVSMPNSLLLCKYNKDFYQEEKNEIPSGLNGVSVTGAKISKDNMATIKLKNKGMQRIDIEGRYIQKKIGDKWYNMPTESRYVEAGAGIGLPTEVEEEFNIFLEKYGELERGIYRGVIEYYLYDENKDEEDENETENYEDETEKICYKVAGEFEIR